ncbi:CGNR zinc finger domain-containing protein [Streptomyces sp. NBC_01718]|uniref:CGNR zinc finger domain-containing protein n=1 Tax=unclassified Streptomyces TaxID=2593676 RepID=UPI00352BF62B
MREYGAHDCQLLFVGTPRPGRRRRCAMERCGNRHKARAHRARHREGDACADRPRPGRPRPRPTVRTVARDVPRHRP